MPQVSLGLTKVIQEVKELTDHSENNSYRSEEDVAYLLQKFEAKTNVFSYQFDGVSIWQIIRFSVSFRLQNLPHSKRQLPRSDVIRSCVEGLKIWKLFSFLFKSRPDYLIFSYYSALRLRVGSSYKDVYSDDYLAGISGGAKVLRINARGYRSKLKQQAREPIYDISALMLIAGVLRRFFSSQESLQQCEKIADLVRVHLGLTDFDAHSVLDELNSFLWQSRLYEIFLRIVKPKACVSPDACAFSLIHACRRLAIKFVELQHGVFTKHHPEILSVESSKYSSSFLLPDGIALYGRYWLREIDGTLQCEKKILSACGNPVLESFREARKNKGPVREKLSLVVTTNGVDTSRMADFIEEFMLLFSSKIDLTVKLHPAYDPDASQYYKIASRFPCARVIEGNENPSTFELVASADLHLSLASACHYDSLAIGTPTAIIALSGHELVLPLVHLRLATLLNKPKDLGQLLDSIARGECEVPVAVQEDFCATDSVAKFKSLLELC